MPSLFDGQSLSDYFETTVVSNVIKDIDNLPEGQFLSSTDEEIIIYIFSKHEIIPLQIFEDAKYARHEDIKVRYKDDHNREYDGLKFNVMLPFAGNSELWYLKPSRYVANFPEGSVLDYIDGSGILVFDRFCCMIV